MPTLTVTQANHSYFVISGRLLPRGSQLPEQILQRRARGRPPASCAIFCVCYTHSFLFNLDFYRTEVSFRLRFVLWERAGHGSSPTKSATTTICAIRQQRTAASREKKPRKHCRPTRQPSRASRAKYVFVETFEGFFLYLSNSNVFNTCLVQGEKVRNCQTIACRFQLVWRWGVRSLKSQSNPDYPRQS